VAANVPVPRPPVDARSRRARRRLVARTALRIGATIALLFALYMVAPVAVVSAADVLLRLVLVVVLVAARRRRGTATVPSPWAAGGTGVTAVRGARPRSG
jgi:hypothetical protein